MVKFFNTAVSLGEAKEAALYYDKVFPLDCGIPILEATGILSGQSNSSYINSSENLSSSNIVNELTRSKSGYRYYKKINGLFASAIAFSYFKPPDEFEFDDDTQLYLSRIEKASGYNFNSMSGYRADSDHEREEKLKKIVDLGFQHLNETEFQRSAFWQSETFQYPKEVNDTKSLKFIDKFQFTLRSLDLVDTSNASWEQILEFRKDRKSMASLAKFRSFFYENYENSDSQFILDKIFTLHENQKETTRIWGFQTVKKALSVVFHKDTALASSAAALTGLAAGGPVASLAGLVVPIGNLLLEISQSHIEQMQWKRDNPLDFLTRLEKIG